MHKEKYIKSIIITLLVLAVVLITSGCSLNTDNPIDPNNGFWDKYFVYTMSSVLDFFADFFNGNYGVSIIITTIILRLLIVPLTMKQLRSSKAMQELQPELKKLQEKYKNNPDKLNEEYMKLLQKNNANPLGGCLPMIVQMIVLIALYHAIIRNTFIGSSVFIVWELGESNIIFPVLAAVATYFQTKVMKFATVNKQAELQRKMMLIMMPAMILIIGLNLPSALSLYWLVSNVFGIVQNLIVYSKK